MTNITAAEWRLVLSYDAESGVLSWLPRDVKKASDKTWNARFAGSPAGCRDARYGVVRYQGKNHLAHRVCWMLATGREPEGQIDHVNGDSFDNRLSNLRDVSPSENCRNLPIKNTNKSGVMGVYKIKSTGLWCAQITTKNGALKHVGNFKTLAEAALARKIAEKAHGYHENHGRAA